jgi:hypothetical protein
MNLRISGFSVSACAGKALHNQNNTVNLFISAGFMTGRLLVKSENQGARQNIFVSPLVRLQPKFILNKLAVSIVGEYSYDLSDTVWKRTFLKGQSALHLPSFQQSGFSAFVCLGFHW